MIASRLWSFPFLSLAFAVASPAAAQEVVQAIPGTTDADVLATDMRRLAANPRDIDSLVDAARLSLSLGDLRAAGALLQRAENVNPRDPRVRAGQASVLLQSERPGQSLRYFAEAEVLGLDADAFAADRGLAYDLTGQQERAQRDYARALRLRPADDETIRRYALSLAISGQRDRALALLDPLVRRSDRAAWRSQAFVLAMTGDVGGAQRIAATMMPGGAGGLAAFFERLPTLPAVDRAFAVHFGEVRPTPERYADARLAPPLAALPREPVVLASVQPVPSSAGTTGRRDRDRRRRGEGPPPVMLASVQPLPQPAAARPARAAETIVAAAGEPASATLVTPSVPPTSATSIVPGRPSRSADAEPATPTQVASTVALTAMPTLPAASEGMSPSPATVVVVPPVQVVEVPRSEPWTVPIIAVRPPPATAASRARGDAILARIVAGLSIPGGELGVLPPPRAEPIAPAVPVAIIAAVPVQSRVAVASRAVVPVDQAAIDRAAAVRALAEKRVADRKAVADRKLTADRKAAAEKKAIADREAAEKKRVERANPGRIWVQVAGGAYEGDLPKAYAAVKAKAPAVFGSRGGFTTPLRATNRVLTGPFKTDAEARTFVNDLRKEGVSAFTFESDAGQPVARLGAKGKVDDAASGKDDSAVKDPTRSKRRR